MSAERTRPLAPARREHEGPAEQRRRRTPLTAITGGAAYRRGRFDAVRAPLHSTSGVPFLVLCATILLGALLAVLVLNTTLARGSYEMSQLQRDVGRTAQDVQGLQEGVRQAEAQLDDKARRLGMVPAENPTMISVLTGQVVTGATP
ncbi:hypothetical protein L1785_20350 [Antribacter sp. KLBMP9083]|uniref:Cell division protein FtsL n=1 Tax=Antribacter soli TaxID=2910976 RepID=A0AA41QHN4_9MICO|nr:hypothetical protein [Antribacter soli]MCF4123323.1 hypothetical protein [Antribacter soli]